MSTLDQKIRVGVCGALGRMGRLVVQTILKQTDMSLVLAVAPRQAGEDVALACGMSTPCGLILSSDLTEALASTSVDVVVEFTTPESVFTNSMAILESGARPLIGATGLSDTQLRALKIACDQRQLGGLYAPNFSIGALLMMQFAAHASRYLAHAELIEYHHNQKVDAPSGTALRTAELMATQVEQFGQTNTKQEKETLTGARGAVTEAGLHIHSVRLPGLLAHQEVMFGDPGQVLTIRHDAFDRQCYMPGVMLGIRGVVTAQSFLVGLEHFM